MEGEKGSIEFLLYLKRRNSLWPYPKIYLRCATHPLYIERSGEGVYRNEEGGGGITAAGRFRAERREAIIREG